MLQKSKDMTPTTPQDMHLKVQVKIVEEENKIENLKLIFFKKVKLRCGRSWQNHDSLRETMHEYGGDGVQKWKTQRVATKSIEET